MFDIGNLTSFVAVVFGLFLIPGPAVLLVLTRTAQGGLKIGILTGLGIASGDLIHTLFATLGLSAILTTSVVAFSVVKIVGAGYLIYLGTRALLEKPSHPSQPTLHRTILPMRAFSQAILAEVLNPKTAIFFLAFLPQFMHADKGSAVLQFMMLGLIFAVLSGIYTTLIAISTRHLGRLAKRLRWIGRWREKIVGAIFLSLGVKVALQHR